jgi:hypothetical protein
MAGIHERRGNSPDKALRCYQRIVADYPGDDWAEYAENEIWRLREVEAAAGETS